MKEIRNILGWMGMAEARSILEDACKHVDEVSRTVMALAEAVSAFIKGDINGKIVAIENVRQSEHQADTIRARILDQLSEGLLLPTEHAEWIKLAKNIDKISDWTNSAARLLGFIEGGLTENVLKNMSRSTELIVESVKALGAAIQAMTKDDFTAALVACDNIDRLEHEADDQKKAMIEAVIRAKLEPTNLLLCYNLAEALEGVTDKIGSVGDLIKTLVIKTR